MITKLKEILKDLDYELIKGNLDINIKDVKDNSKKVQEGDLFIAIVGTEVDSHNYIPNAIENGAKVIVIEKDVEIPEDVTVIKVKSSRKALAKISAAYFDFPAKKLTTIGITGTCGKTSTSYIIKAIVEKAGFKSGIIGTIGAMIGDKKIETHNTTPNAHETQKLFYDMAEQGCKYVVMEVSSQGLKMDRVAGIEFDYGIFTNISMDHIGPNEHEDYADYIYCKSLLFTQCKTGIINIDSEKYKEVIKNHTCKIIKYGIESEDADIKAGNIKFVAENNFLGEQFDVIGEMNETFRIDIPGKFSVYNALCAITVAHLLGIDAKSMKEALETIKVNGRMELASSNSTYKLIIDYAHNKDEITNLMEAISDYKPKRIISITGAGGNRAKKRRYDLGEVCGKWSSLTILTNDNLRFEEMEAIHNDIIVGLNKSNGNYMIIKDRKEAIRYAVENAQEGDMILLLGKGHENYLDIKGVKYPWSEKQAVIEVEQELKEKMHKKSSNKKTIVIKPKKKGLYK